MESSHDPKSLCLDADLRPLASGKLGGGSSFGFIVMGRADPYETCTHIRRHKPGCMAASPKLSDEEAKRLREAYGLEQPETEIR